MDLLLALGTGDESKGIRFGTAGSLGPVYDISNIADVRDIAAKYFDSEILEDFGISTVIKMRSDTGYLFSVVSPNNILQLGAVISPLRDSMAQMTVFYTSDSRTKRRSDTLAVFNMPAVKNKWTKLGIEVEGQVVTLYQNCKEVASKSTPSRDPLVIEEGSTLFIGSSTSSTSKFEVKTKQIILWVFTSKLRLLQKLKSTFELIEIIFCGIHKVLT